MVAGVFVARWTVPVALKGTSYVLAGPSREAASDGLGPGCGHAVGGGQYADGLRGSKCGLSIAFPLWNINSLVGLFWGWLLFHELRGSGWGRVVGGAVAIVGGACLLAYATAQHSNSAGRRGAGNSWPPSARD